MEKTHSCRAKYVGSVAVSERFDEQMSWQGIVEVFALIKHPSAKRCYAWNYDVHGEERFVSVLEIPPVCSALSAVRTAIANKEQKDPEGGAARERRAPIKSVSPSNPALDKSTSPKIKVRSRN